MGGTLEYLSGLLGGSGGHGHEKTKKRKQLQTVELKVRMDCEGCELKVKSALSSMKGPLSVSFLMTVNMFCIPFGSKKKMFCVPCSKKFQSHVAHQVLVLM